MPQPLKDRDHAASDIWGKQIELLPGSHVHVHAPSGTGKSTLIHILYALRKDFTGELFINGSGISYEPSAISILRKNSVSIVFQDMRLFPELTGMENIMIKKELTDNTGEQRVRTMMEALGAAHLENRQAKLMSLGEQQRIAIIRAMQQPFKWLLLDEPFSHLDRRNIVKASALIMEICKQNNAGLLLASLGETYDMEFSLNLNL